ncbi:MAG: SusF/SusE family outer membrane protein [Bacteroidaceae bacterium]|nr:SusF/SusE family outer membrane protein [Bacteroidaceae bacterium]
MKTNKHIFTCLTALILTAFFAGCENEGGKELVIIEGELPIKTTSLYMVGDATPNGWDIGNPTPLQASVEDPLVFTWEGSLYAGEIKLCLTPGSWDVAFIRPEVGGTEISKTDISNQKFVMNAGDPDNKWKVVDAGKYRLTFDLRNWTMSTVFTGENDVPVVEPIETEVLYIVGDATPVGWNIDSPSKLEKKSKYIFVYEGELNKGELKACMETGDWNAPFIRPSSSDCRIDKTGVAATDFILAANPDNKWKVADAGNYRLTFDLEHWTIKVEFLSEIVVTKDPIESETLYMIGDATPGGWSMDAATAFTNDASNKYIFTWEGELVPGDMKACLEPDGTFSCPFLRPSASDVEINATGVTATDFVYTTSPDDKWHVTEAGTYHITFDLEHWTIQVEKK